MINVYKFSFIHMSWLMAAFALLVTQITRVHVVSTLQLKWIQHEHNKVKMNDFRSREWDHMRSTWIIPSGEHVNAEYYPVFTSASDGRLFVTTQIRWCCKMTNPHNRPKWFLRPVTWYTWCKKHLGFIFTWQTWHLTEVLWKQRFVTSSRGGWCLCWVYVACCAELDYTNLLPWCLAALIDRRLRIHDFMVTWCQHAG